MADVPDRGRRPAQEDVEDAPTEQTPLLPSAEPEAAADQSQPQRQTSARRSLLSSLHEGGKQGQRRRWPSLVALLLLCVLVVVIIVFAFIAPSTVEQYAQQAVVFKPTSLSIHSFTSTGVRARVQGDFMMDARRVQRKPVRHLGRFFTFVARAAESGESEVEVSLPEYGNVVLGTARVPGIKVDLRSGHTTHVDFLSDLQPGDPDGIRRIALDWVDGRLGQLRVLGKADVPLRSGMVSLGKQTIVQEMLFANKDIPSIPAYDIKKLNVHEVELPNGGSGMAADVSLVVMNDYPVDFTVPPLAFSVLVDNCEKDEPYIKLVDAETHELHIAPKQKVELNVTGVVHHLPTVLTQDCPGSHKSPLDVILGRYIHGEDNTVYVQGSSSDQLHTPQWITDLMADISVPVPIPGKTFGHLIKNFSLADTHFSLPSPFAEPGTDAANPRISAQVNALVALPGEMNFNISVGRVRADADVFYQGKKLGNLDLRRWQKANSTRIEASKDHGPMLMVESSVEDAPLRISDQDVFTDVIQSLLFGKKGVVMDIKAEVDVEVETALGAVTARKIPAEGRVPVKPISSHPGKGLTSGFKPQVFDLKILDTTPTGLNLSALINITNPTPYSADIPYIDIHILANGSLLGHATARNLAISPGPNRNLLITAMYDPSRSGGPAARETGRELLSQYISGRNTTLTLQMHAGSIPAQPLLSRALAAFPLDLPTPRLRPPPAHDPADPDDERPRFIQDATMHLLSSTATFTLLSPLAHTTLFVTSINATAFYKGDAVGRIEYEAPFAVPPVDEQGEGVTSPRLPVAWRLGGVGYEAVKRALGGRLRLSAFAWVGVRVGEWEEVVWFRGRGIGAGVRL